jgi:hypothetical protein
MRSKSKAFMRRFILVTTKIQVKKKQIIRMVYSTSMMVSSGKLIDFDLVIRLIKLYYF